MRLRTSLFALPFVTSLALATPSIQKELEPMQPKTMPNTNDAIRPFHVHFSDAELADLKRRINTTRFPAKKTVDDQSQDVQLTTIQKLATYWRTKYD